MNLRQALEAMKFLKPNRANSTRRISSVFNMKTPISLRALITQCNAPGPNIAVTGRLMIDSRTPWQGAKVFAKDRDFGPSCDDLGSDFTDSAGYFYINYNPDVWGGSFEEGGPDISITIPYILDQKDYPGEISDRVYDVGIIIPVTVPDVRNMLKMDAELKILSSGLKFKETYEYGVTSSTPGLVVLDQDPEAGKKIPYGDIVEIDITTHSSPPSTETGFSKVILFNQNSNGRMLHIWLCINLSPQYAFYKDIAYNSNLGIDLNDNTIYRIVACEDGTANDPNNHIDSIRWSWACYGNRKGSVQSWPIG